MKTATIPALRVEPKLRESAENVLAEGETLSSFVEESLKANIERRIHQKAFIARGIASRDEAKTTQEYYAADSVINELKDMLKKA
jgi:hypothetical protein